MKNKHRTIQDLVTEIENTYKSLDLEDDNLIELKDILNAIPAISENLDKFELRNFGNFKRLVNIDGIEFNENHLNFKYAIDNWNSLGYLTKQEFIDRYFNIPQYGEGKC